MLQSLSDTLNDKSQISQFYEENVKDTVAEANKLIYCLSEQEAIALHGNPEVLFVDLRDVRELQREGKVSGAFHCPRGMLKFWIDKKNPYAKPEFRGRSSSYSSVRVVQDPHWLPGPHRKWD